MHSSALSPLLSSSDAGSSVSSLRYSPAAIKKWHICDVGIAERQKVGKQGKDNSIKLFSIQHFLFQYTCILCYYPYLVSLFSCHSHITTFHYVFSIFYHLWRIVLEDSANSFIFISATVDRQQPRWHEVGKRQICTESPILVQTSPDLLSWTVERHA